MIRPHAFRVNEETAVDNKFQATAVDEPAGVLAARALAEVDRVIAALEEAGVTVHVFDDDGTRDTPDSLFPNNWISAGPDGRIVLYPMFTPNRRRERRADVVRMLRGAYDVSEIMDWSSFESEDQILEGTGSIVFDYVNRIAYAARSERADEDLFAKYCDEFGFEQVLFDALDQDGDIIYHTNVVMAVCEKIALVGLDCVADQSDRARISARLSATGHEIVTLTQAQINAFAGNCLELEGESGPVLVMSSRALAAFRPEQIATIERHMAILTFDIPTIELAGGSVRCLMADVHLQKSSEPT